MSITRVATRDFVSASLAGGLALLWLAGCATTPPPQNRTAADETVDVGYGEMARGGLAAPVATVDGTDPNAPRFRTLAEMLSRVPGVRVSERPDGTLIVRIRGSTSFQSNEEPLVVLDGQTLASLDGIVHLDANHIASISVLKDAGETAIYGARGANGVILIRTKR